MLQRLPETCIVLCQHRQIYDLDSRQVREVEVKSDRDVFHTIQRSIITATNKRIFATIRDVESARGVIMHSKDSDIDTPFQIFYISSDTLDDLVRTKFHCEVVKLSSLNARSSVVKNIDNKNINLGSYIQRCIPGLLVATESYYKTRDIELFSSE